MAVIAIAPHGASNGEHAVDRPREAHAEAEHSARHRPLVVRFDDDVHVVRLHREVKDAKRAAQSPRLNRSTDGSTHRPEERLLAERRQPSARAERDVHGMARAMQWTRTMGHARSAFALALATCTGASAAP